MTTEQPEVLLFDLGGVLVENVMFDELPALLPEPIEDRDLRTRWLCSPSVQAFERGYTVADVFAEEFISEWRLACSPTQFLEAFTAWPKGPYPGAVELLDGLRDRYRLALLSNCNAIHWDRIADLRDGVHAAFSSHLLGMVKPDPSIFQRVADELQVDPRRICFFDDSPANVEAARSVGMQAYCTNGVEEVELAIREIAG